MRRQFGKRLLTVLAFLLGLGAILLWTSRVFTPKDNSEEAGMHYVRAHSFLGEPDHTVDVVILGDSIVYSCISPMEMWGHDGIAAYDCATGAQSLDLTWYYVKQIVKRQCPKVLMIEGLTALRKMKANDCVYWEAAGRFPVLIDHSYWKRLKWSDVLTSPNYTHIELEKGFYANFKRKAYRGKRDYMADTGQRREMPLLNRLYLDRILALCRGNGIQVVFLSTPSPVNWSWANHCAVEDYARSRGVDYLDLNLSLEEMEIDLARDFRDRGDHLNFYGARKISIAISAFLRDRYALPDHRQEEGYQRWNEDWAEYQRNYQDK